MSLSIRGLGTSVPPHTMSQAEALQLAEAVLEPDSGQQRKLAALYRRAGVKNRHLCIPYETGFDWAAIPSQSSGNGRHTRRGASTAARMQLYEQYAAPQAVAAATSALQQANSDPDQITHLVTVSCTGFSSPGVDASLIRQLPLRPDVQRVHVGFMGCHGAINGLRVADALAQCNERYRVLLCAVELCSLHYYFDWHPERLVSNSLFADGAAALVGDAHSNGSSQCQWRVLATSSFVLPESQESMTWKLGDFGFEMTLSASVPQQIADSLRPWLTSWLNQQGVCIDDIKHWAIHPGGPRILAAVADALDLPASATDISREILAQFGNMSSPTVLFIADRLKQKTASGLGIAMAFGPGLVAEVALIDFGG